MCPCDEPNYDRYIFTCIRTSLFRLTCVSMVTIVTTMVELDGIHGGYTACIFWGRGSYSASIRPKLSKSSMRSSNLGERGRGALGRIGCSVRNEQNIPGLAS